MKTMAHIRATEVPFNIQIDNSKSWFIGLTYYLLWQRPDRLYTLGRQVVVYNTKK